MQVNEPLGIATYPPRDAEAVPWTYLSVSVAHYWPVVYKEEDVRIEAKSFIAPCLQVWHARIRSVVPDKISVA